MLLIGSLTMSQAQNANTTLSNLIAPTAVNQSLLPNSHSSLNLGSSLGQWANLYLGNSIYFGGYRSITINPGNIAIGGNSLLNNTTGSANTAIGNLSMYSNTTGLANSSCGAYAMYWNTTGQFNTALGNFALMNNTTANYNTALGSNSLQNNSTGTENTGVGREALYTNTSGNYNSALGADALAYNTDGDANTAMGRTALYNNTTGSNNTASGYKSLYYNTSGIRNTASGQTSLYNNTTGNYNAGIGYSALYNNTTGTGNVAIGYTAGDNHNLSYCTYVGYDANATAPQLVFNNSMALGRGSRVTAGYQVRIGTSSTSSIGGYENWTNLSDGRYKKNIEENVPGLEFITKLRPVTYTLDIRGINEKSKLVLNDDEQDGVVEKEKMVHTGFIAQEVEKTAKEIGYNFSGVDAPKNTDDFYGLRYAEFTVPLVKSVQELAKQNEELKNEIRTLRNDFNELAKKTAHSSNNNYSTGFLGQNTPNPFNGNTTIPFVLPVKFSFASLKLINSQTGQSIKEYQLSPFQASQEITLNLANGVYSYSLVIDGVTVDTKQMINLK